MAEPVGGERRRKRSDDEDTPLLKKSKLKMEELFSVILKQSDIDGHFLKLEDEKAVLLARRALISESLMLKMFNFDQRTEEYDMLLTNVRVPLLSIFYGEYRIEGGWADFAREHELKAGHKVSFYKQGGSYLIKHIKCYELFSKCIKVIEDVLDLEVEEGYELLTMFGRYRLLNVYDDDGNQYKFEARSRKKDPSQVGISGQPGRLGTPTYPCYRIDEGWSEFVAKQKVEAGDKVTFYQRGTDYVVSVLKQENVTDHVV